MCLLLKVYELRRTLDAKYFRQEFYPECLAFSLLISPAFPFLGEGSGSHALLFLCLHLVFLPDTKIAIKNKVSKRSGTKISFPRFIERHIREKTYICILIAIDKERADT